MNRERIDTGVLIVGGGPAGLACALRLTQRIAADELAGETPRLSAEEVFLLEKGAELGAHSLSGAVMDPRALSELVPDYHRKGAPIECKVTHDSVYHMREHGAFRLPVVPAFMDNRGQELISLGKLVKWLGEQVESAGANVFTGMAASNLIYEADAVCGVITDDKGLDKHGKPGENFEAGLELHARVTVLAEGARGSLSTQLVKRFALDTHSNPPAYGLGVKEIWEVPSGRIAPGTVWHTFGYPLPADMQGGGWLYALPGNRVSIGLVAGLHYANPHFDTHHALQLYKQHPLIRDVLAGGKVLNYGARVLSKGGYWSLPKLYAPGVALVGDAAGFLDSLRLKGVHMAIKSGMLAADAIYDNLVRDESALIEPVTYHDRFDASWMKADLWRARNHHQGFSRGLLPGLAHVALQSISGGRGVYARYEGKMAHTYLDPARRGGMPKIKFDGVLTFDKLSSVFYSGTAHRENQPVHLRLRDAAICGQCGTTFGNPCQYFCPAGVYEMVEDHTGERQLKINAANCVHCKTCDIMDPYLNIEWTPPEGGGGPRYDSM